jgi:histidinol phosphatase-like enzyme
MDELLEKDWVPDISCSHIPDVKDKSDYPYRKPALGMLLHALDDFAANAHTSWMIGEQY